MAFTSVNQLFDVLWKDYCAFNPQAKRVHDLLVGQGESIHNDHIALRTFRHPRLGLGHLAKAFEGFGYKPVQDYVFKEKKLYAKHWQHPDSKLPKVFISELELEKLSAKAQNILQSLIEQIPANFLEREDVATAGRPWKVSYSQFEILAQESEYAAWVSSHGFRPNHFTVFFNELKTFPDLKALNAFLRKNGYTLNESGGEIKGTPAELLEQSSTMAETTTVEFSEGPQQVPACYYEFARRYKNPKTGELYHGFIANSADKIFESTDRQIRSS